MSERLSSSRSRVAEQLGTFPWSRGLDLIKKRLAARPSGRAGPGTEHGTTYKCVSSVHT